MKLSNIQYNILLDLSEGWILIQGKVILGRPIVCYLKNSVNGQVQMISNVTFRSLKRKELINLSGENETTFSYVISDTGKNSIKKHF